MNQTLSSITAATKARGYLAGDPATEAVGQVYKLFEELAELAVSLGINHQWGVVTLVGNSARRRFDQPQLWQPITPDDGWEKELADVTVVLVNLAAMLAEATGQPVDVLQLALAKAQADAARGRRGS